MLKPPVKFVCLIALPLLMAFCFNGGSVRADDPPTQQNQLVYPTTYVPLKRGNVVGGQPVVQMTLNKTQSVAFLADTGAASTVLSAEVAKQLKLKLQPAFQDNGTPILWKGKQPSEAAVSFIQIGNFTMNVQQGFFVILDRQTLMADPSPKPDDILFDGVLGVNILEHFAVLLDASQHTLGLCVPGNLNLHQVSQFGYTPPYAVPITQKEGHWFVTVQLTNNGISQSEDLILDTGSNQTVVSNTAAEHLGLKITEAQQTTNAYSDNVPVGASSMETMQIGNITLSGHAIGVSSDLKLLPPQLGMDILSGYRVLIDFPAKKMYLQSNTAAAVPAITIGPAPAPTVPPAK